jgi:glutamine synthetase
VNGSGKHNNWSMVTDDGINLLDPGDTPHENMIFLTMLCAVISAVDKNSKLLRASVANTGNDHRLGANEAPPAIVSVFLGDQLGDIFEQLAGAGAKSSKKGGELKLGVSTLPPLPKDCTDRNRTSPFAYTGNRFEFRMVGSSQSIAGPNFVLNTIVADALCLIADELEKSKNMTQTTQKILKQLATDHAKIIFNGDNYSEAWVEEAAKRGLPNIRSTVESIEGIPTKENTQLFKKHGVLTPAELKARTEILLEVYNMQINIEAGTTLSMAKRQIMPSCIEYTSRLGNAVAAVNGAGVDPIVQVSLLKRVNSLITDLQNAIETLEAAKAKAGGVGKAEKRAESCRDDVVPAMNAVRAAADELEALVDADLWPLPTYAEMLFMR